MKRIRLFFFLLFISKLAFSTSVPFNKIIYLDSIKVEKDSIKTKRHIDVSKHVMQGSFVAGLIFLGWGALEVAEPCPQTNSYVNLCFNGLGQIALGVVLIFIGALIFLGRKLSDSVMQKRKSKPKKNK